MTIIFKSRPTHQSREPLKLLTNPNHSISRCTNSRAETALRQTTALLPLLAPHRRVQLIPTKAKGPKSQLLVFKSQYLYYFHFTQPGLSSELSINASWHTSSLERKLKKPCWWSMVSPSHGRADREAGSLPCCQGQILSCRKDQHSTPLQEAALVSHTHRNQSAVSTAHAESSNRYRWTKDDSSVCRITPPKQRELISCPSGAFHAGRK